MEAKHSFGCFELMEVIANDMNLSRSSSPDMSLSTNQGSIKWSICQLIPDNRKRFFSVHNLLITVWLGLFLFLFLSGTVILLPMWKKGINSQCIAVKVYKGKAFKGQAI